MKELYIKSTFNQDDEVCLHIKSQKPFARSYMNVFKRVIPILINPSFEQNVYHDNFKYTIVTNLYECLLILYTVYDSY